MSTAYDCCASHSPPEMHSFMRILLIVSCLLLGDNFLRSGDGHTFTYIISFYVKDHAPKQMEWNVQSKMNNSRAQMQGSITSSGMWKTTSNETVSLPYLQASNVCRFNVEATNCTGLFARDEKEFKTALTYQT